MFVMPNLRNVVCPKCNRQHTGCLDQVFILQQYPFVNGKLIPNLQEYYFNVGDRLEMHEKIGLGCAFCQHQWIFQDPLHEGPNSNDNWISKEQLYQQMIPEK